MDTRKTVRDILNDSKEEILEIIRQDMKKTYYGINDVDNEGYTDLMIACYYQDLEIAKDLLNFGANPNISNKNGENAAYLAVMGSYTFEVSGLNLVELLHKFDADFNKAAISNRTPLGLSCSYNMTEMTRKLIQLKADIHAPNIDNCALVVACNNNSINSIYSLCMTAKNPEDIDKLRQELTYSKNGHSKNYTSKILESIDINLKLEKSINNKKDRHWGGKY